MLTPFYTVDWGSFLRGQAIAIVSSNERRVTPGQFVRNYFYKIQATLVVHETKLVQDKNFPSIYRAIGHTYFGVKGHTHILSNQMADDNQ